MEYGSKGIWAMAEWIRWKRGEADPQNWGLGITSKADYGQTKDGKHDWGSFAIGSNVDYWTELGLGDASALAKFRAMYRWKKDGTNGFMPDLYLEYNRSMGADDKLIVPLEVQYFKDDSYGSASLLWEKRLNQDWKVKAGLSLTTDFTGSDGLGFGPTASIRYDNRWIFGASASLINAQNFGIFGGYEINEDWRDQYAKSKEESVSLVAGQKNSGETVKFDPKSGSIKQ